VSGTRYLALLLLLNGVPVCSFGIDSSAQFANSEQDPARRSATELNDAEQAFDDARAAYDKGDIDKGDAELEKMTKALDACLGSLEVAHKARYFKKAEIKVALLQRRMSGLLDDIELPRRGWAEQTSRKLDEIHDKLLAGAMRK
jgi:hypothetical protein